MGVDVRKRYYSFMIVFQNVCTYTGEEINVDVSRAQMTLKSFLFCFLGLLTITFLFQFQIINLLHHPVLFENKTNRFLFTFMLPFEALK